MLFSSLEFILLFLPVTLAVFWCLTKNNYYQIAIAWLIIASLFFYAWWNPPYVILLICLTLFNYLVGNWLQQEVVFELVSKWRNKFLLTFGITVDLGSLIYYKYANFFIDNINNLLATNIQLTKIVLPLGISFFTFQQIAYLVDSYYGKVKHTGLLKYNLFIFFFPQLIAGPIVHYSEILPQFSRQSLSKFRGRDLAVGSTIFILGLAKKVILADSIAATANPIFDAADGGVTIYFAEAWMGAIAYALQLYFDFSGYSDMAIGIGRMVGVQLPQNFNSPYKANNIIDFWRWWHMTLSKFLKDYLYIPLGGNRQGTIKRYRNLMLTMLLGGLWHGASWNYVIWGGLHGFFLTINHQWRSFCSKKKLSNFGWSWLNKIIGVGITFCAVIFAWVFFRAQTWQGAISMLAGMTGSNSQIFAPVALVPTIYKELALLLAIVWLLPNTWQWLEASERIAATNPQTQKIKNILLWQPNSFFGLAIGILLFACLKTSLSATQSEFLYFDF